MNEAERLVQLEIEVAELRARVGHDDETRRTLLAATEKLVPALEQRQQQLEVGMLTAATALRNAPEQDRLREQGLLPKFNGLLLRQQAVEREFDELRRFAIHTFELQQAMAEVFKDMQDFLRGFGGGSQTA